MSAQGATLAELDAAVRTLVDRPETPLVLGGSRVGEYATAISIFTTPGDARRREPMTTRGREKTAAEAVVSEMVGA